MTGDVRLDIYSCTDSARSRCCVIRLVMQPLVLSKTGEGESGERGKEREEAEKQQFCETQGYKSRGLALVDESSTSANPSACL